MDWDGLKQDIHYALRTLARDLGFFAAAALIIGLGVGANTAIFSVVNALLFRPLQFTAPNRLVWIANTGDSLSGVTSRVSNFLDWARMNRSLEAMSAYFAFFDYGTYDLVGSGEPERLVGVGVAQNFLDFLGVPPRLGRNFNAQESKWNGTPAVILTHGLWQAHFGSDPNIIGRSIDLNSKPTTIIGVLPASFDFSTVFTPGSRIDMLVPFPLTPETDRWGNTLAVMGRLKPGVSIKQAQAEFDVLNDQLRKQHPERYVFGAKFTALQEHLTGRFRRGLLVLLCAVGAVLLIACTNLSNLLLARASSRRKEMAVRSALGASRWRLVRQVLTESLVLSFSGAALGLAFAYAGIQYLASIHSINIPLLHTVRMDGSALLFTTVAALATGVLFGMIPALQSSGANEADSLKDAGRGLSESRQTAWTRGALVMAEVALACVLLVGAGLLIRSFAHLLEVDPGFRPEHAAVWRIDTAGRYKTDARTLAFYDRLVRSVEAVPGVESAGITDALPLSRDRTWGAPVKGAVYSKDNFPLAHPRLVDWRYIHTMRIPLIAGRQFDEHDTANSAKVIIINQKMARQLFGNSNPLGQVIQVNDDRQVVGVVGNVRHEALETEGGMEMYLPITQNVLGSVELVVRTKLAPEDVAPSIRAALRSVDVNLPNAEYQDLTALVDRAVSPRRFMMGLLGAFALAALLLAAVGIYGVVSYTVSQRTTEIGIRMALGASAGQVQRQVMSQTVAWVGTGIAVGVIAALLLARLTASLLYQMSPADPATFAVTVVTLLTAAILASYIPARRAAHIEPMNALRTM